MLEVVSMKTYIRDINELTDSRELLESKPHPFIPIFITIICLSLFIALIWSYIGEMDVVAKTSGVVRPNEAISTVQSEVMGKASGVFFYEGKEIKAGEKLFSLEIDDLTVQKQIFSVDLQKEKGELENLIKLKESIEGKKNLFTKNAMLETEFYEQYLKYELDYQKLESELIGNNLQLEKIEQDLQSNNSTLNVEMERLANQENKNHIDVQKLEEDKTKIGELIHNYTLLEKSVVLNQDNLKDIKDKKFNNLYSEFENSLEKLNNQVNIKKEQYDRSVLLGEKYIPRVQLENEKKEYEAALLEVETYRNNKLLEIRNTIDNYREQLKVVEKDLLLLTKGSPIKTEEKSIHTQKNALMEKKEMIGKEIAQGEKYKEITLEKFKTDKIVEINGLILNKEKVVKSLEDNLQTINLQIEERTVKSPIDGIVNVSTELNIGDLVQPGMDIVTIVPRTESKYKVVLSVLNRDINRLSIGDEVKYHFLALPYKEYGELKGTITKISTDSTIDPSSGLSFYKVEATIKNEPLYSYKGKIGEIKVGMLTEAYVISDSKKILHFILEKINLRE